MDERSTAVFRRKCSEPQLQGKRLVRKNHTAQGRSGLAEEIRLLSAQRYHSACPEAKASCWIAVLVPLSVTLRRAVRTD